MFFRREEAGGAGPVFEVASVEGASLGAVPTPVKVLGAVEVMGAVAVAVAAVDEVLLAGGSSFFALRPPKRLVLGAAEEVVPVLEAAAVDEGAVSSFFCPNAEKKLLLGAAEDVAAVLDGVLVAPPKRLLVGAVVEFVGALDFVPP